MQSRLVKAQNNINSKQSASKIGLCGWSLRCWGTRYCCFCAICGAPRAHTPDLRTERIAQHLFTTPNSPPPSMSDRESDTGSDLLGTLTVSEDFVPSRTQKQASTNAVDFDGLLQESPLKLHEDLANGNGGQAWPAGFVLAKYLLRKKRDELKHCSMFVGVCLH